MRSIASASTLIHLDDFLNSPQYYEIYKHREVIGISLTFMTVDLLGGVFSILSLVMKESLDITASVAYSLVVV